MTLAQVAGGKLSVALVSKIERGLVSPSLSTLGVLVERLGVRPAALLEEEPARAREVAAGALESVAGSVRVGLLAALAEAALAAGSSGAAAERVLEASRLLSAGQEAAAAGGGGGDGGEARAALAWVLGLLERRRGDRAAAQRSWAACLEALEALDTWAPSGGQGADGARGPWAWLLRARVRLELAALHELEGAPETARIFVLAAADGLRRLADPATAALELLQRGGPAGAGEGKGGGGDVALALAVCACAARLLDQAEHSLARLERSRLRWPAAAAPAEVSHSRHLR